MSDAYTLRIRNLVAAKELPRAVKEINDRYRELGAPVLDVLSRMLTTLVTPTFAGDLAGLGALLRICPPPPGNRLRAFVSDQRAQNCLTAVLRSLEKEVPSSVKVGFRSAADYFRASEFYATYRTDIVQYDPDLRRLTDQRLARLISPDPASLEWSLFDDGPLAKKRDVLSAYEKESMRPVAAAFDETLVKVEKFFDTLSAHAGRFTAFLDSFRRARFDADDDTFSEWSLLGDEYFHIELAKSSLMLPINPKALYWGMHDEYPETLTLLRELKSLVTPDFTIADSRREGGDWKVAVTCENPESLKGSAFEIETALHVRADTLPGRVPVGLVFSTTSPGRSCTVDIAVPPGSPGPLRLTLGVTCEGRYYTRPFRTVKSLEIRGE